MAVIYARRILAGLMALAEVPERWRDEVGALIAEDPGKDAG